jgi:serine/threonine protein kinase
MCLPEDLLGSGMFGQVYGGICKTTKKKVAIKIIQKTKIECEIFETSIFQNELLILQNVDHPGIIRLFAIYEQPETVR